MEPKPVEVLLKEKKIAEVMNPRLLQSPSQTPIKNVVELMQKQKSGYIVIADEKKVIGIFTEVDIVRKLLGKGVDWNRPVRDLMTEDVEFWTPPSVREGEIVGCSEVMGRLERAFSSGRYYERSSTSALRISSGVRVRPSTNFRTSAPATRSVGGSAKASRRARTTRRASPGSAWK